MRRSIALICLVCGLVAPQAALAQGAEESALRRSLDRAMRAAAPSSGAFVLDATDRDILFERRADKGRILASNAKLFTTAAALSRFGPATTLDTTVLAAGELDAQGVLQGDLYLRGGGDPAFGTRSFVRRHYGQGADVESLAVELERLGVREVRGRVVGDESLFDARRGGPDSGFGVSPYVGPLSALALNRGLSNPGGSGFQTDPPAFAASALDAELERSGVRIAGAPRAGSTPGSARPLAAAKSPPMGRLVAITNKQSDNFFAEILLKRLAAAAGGRGTTRTGARAAAAFAAGLGSKARLADGSGLARANRASPRDVAELLDELRDRPEFGPFFESLAVAGRDGTLRDRMRRGPARGRCRGKTGTIAGVSALSGYCRSRDGDTLVFSFLMNATSPALARSLQDRMAHALAAFDDGDEPAAVEPQPEPAGR